MNALPSRHIQVLGFDCPTCRKTHDRIAAVAARLGVVLHLEKVSDPRQIAAYRLLAPPGVVVAGRLVYCGGLPKDRLIEAWLMESQPTSGTEE
ncbi:MAG: thioredoxin family protein [Chromatiaceae bacterium]|nr:thioredoxin family protein [Chromatiaceae bacterium]